METLVSCPVCEKTDFVTKYTCTDLVATSELFNMLECKGCSFLFTNPRPDSNEISKYYKSDNYISHSSESAGLIFSIYKIVRDYGIKQKLRLIKSFNSSGNLLDIGCGLGYFLNGATNDGSFNTTGVDTSDDAVKYVKEHFGISVQNDSALNEFNASSFDVITMWHVLEHVHDLSGRVKQLSRLIKPDGTLFIAVPNSGSWDAGFFKEKWDAYDVPRHLYHFNQKSFKLLMEKNGFKIIETKPLFFDAPYVSMRSAKHAGWPFSFIVGGVIGLISNLMALNNKNYSSLLFVVKKS